MHRLTAFDIVQYGGTRALKHLWDYDALGRKSADNSTGDITVISPYIGTSTNDKIDISYDNDRGNRLAREIFKVDGTSTQWDLQYGYDDAGNRTALNNGTRTFTIGYNSGSGQNRETSIYSPSPTPTPQVLSYDFKGNVTSRKSLVDGSTYAYTWDEFDRMTSAQKGSGTMVYYHYDALGRLLYRDGGAGDETYYYWLGLNKIAEEKLSVSTVEPIQSEEDWHVFGDGEAGGVEEDWWYGYSEDSECVMIVGDNLAGDTEDPWNDSVHTRLTFEVINYVYGLTIDVHVVLTDAREETIYLDGTGANGEWYFPYETWEAADIDLEARAQSQFGEGIAEVVGMTFYGFTGGGLDFEIRDVELSEGYEKFAYQPVPGAAIGGVLASDSTDSGKKYYHYNDLGTVQIETDQDGAKTGLWEPDFFGNYHYAASGNPSRPDLGLTGKQYDPVADLYYFNRRWYDSERGRWMSRAQFRPDVEHPYAYSQSDPINGTDPGGERDCKNRAASIEKMLDKVSAPGFHNWSLCDQLGNMLETFAKHCKGTTQFAKYSDYLRLYDERCNQKRYPQPQPVSCPSPEDDMGICPFPLAPQQPGDLSSVIAVGTAVGGGYAFYRVCRLVPSLIPPLWPSLPVNIITP